MFISLIQELPGPGQNMSPLADQHSGPSQEPTETSRISTASDHTQVASSDKTAIEAPHTFKSTSESSAEGCRLSSSVTSRPHAEKRIEPHELEEVWTTGCIHGVLYTACKHAFNCSNGTTDHQTVYIYSTVTR